MTATPDHRLHVYPDYGWLRGFSVIPSWGARIEEAWWNYDRDRMLEEVMLARRVHANCIRLWIEFPAWMADPDRVTACFLDAIDCIDRAGMRTMPVLFNRWHDPDWDYGGMSIDNLNRNWKPMLGYVRSLVEPLADDPRVLIWDLCNEPQAFSLETDLSKKEFGWLSDVAATVREAGALQPITIGTMAGTNIDVFEPLCDVLCGHPYAHDEAGLDRLIADFKARSVRFGKPFMANETIPGALDDRVRAGVARFYTQKLAAAGFGWMGWALREGKAISTRRDRFDTNGIFNQGFHPFFGRDGKLRDGLEFLTENPAVKMPAKS